MLRFFDNNLNPVFLREIRQFVRNNFIVVLTNLYVFLLAFVFLFYLVSGNSLNVNVSIVGSSMVLGSSVILLFGHIVGLACFLSVVLRTVFCTSFDWINDELLFYSRVKPSTIVFGKLLTGIVITLILTSITMPFVVLLYFMGGIDLLDVLLAFVGVFVTVQVMNALAILIASMSKNSFAPYISLVALSAMLCGVHVLAQMVIDEWKNMPHSEMLSEYTTFLIGAFSLFALFAGGAIANFLPKKSDRSFHVRLIATVIFVTAFVCVLSGFLVLAMLDMLPLFEFIGVTVLTLLLPFVVCESDQWSLRIRRSLPRSLIRRFILFPFYTGSACGLVWVGLIVAALVCIDWLVFLRDRDSLFLRDQSIVCRVITLLFIFSFDICVTAMLIRSHFLKWLDTSRVWLIAACILLFVSLSSVGGYFVYGEFCFVFWGSVAPSYPTADWWVQYRDSPISAINPIVIVAYLPPYIQKYGIFAGTVEIFVSEESLSRFYAAIGWAVILLPFLAIWYFRRLKDFTPYIEEDTGTKGTLY
ncbi:MAG: hypothetical protein LBJ00_03305 [Planctomycetaceae bacterium]|nr:hypothetical protein [Planctomycetaceae bacterium]